MDFEIAGRRPQLLASTGTLKGMERAINRFYFSTGYVVDEETLAIRNQKTGRTIEALRVVKQGGRKPRYRLEALW